MFRPHPGSNLALTLRRLRSHFGISAPKMAVRTHVPWPWRALGMIIVIAAALALSGWIYDAGMRFAGFDRSLTEQEIKQLREQVSTMTEETAHLRNAVSASDSKLQIEHTALQQIMEQVGTLETENVRLKEELAIFENLARSDDTVTGPTISRFRVELDAVPGQYRYRLLVAQRGAQDGREFKGKLQLAVTLKQAGGDTLLVIPGPNDAQAANYAVNFRSFHRLEGVFKLPAGAIPTSVEVRLVQNGSIKTAQRINL